VTLLAAKVLALVADSDYSICFSNSHSDCSSDLAGAMVTVVVLYWLLSYSSYFSGCCSALAAAMVATFPVSLEAVVVSPFRSLSLFLQKFSINFWQSFGLIESCSQ
jgi:hypothetical protein